MEQTSDHFACTSAGAPDNHANGQESRIRRSEVSLFFALTGTAFHLRAEGIWILIFILLYIASFAVALGPVVWVVIAEIFPTRIRGRAMSIATVCLWVSCYLVSVTFPILVELFGDSFTFWLYSVMCVVTFAFVWFVLPETKGRSLEDIEKRWLRSPSQLR